jgi:hypothetical protein
MRPGAPSRPPPELAERPLFPAISAYFGLRPIRRVLPLAIHAAILRSARYNPIIRDLAASIDKKPGCGTQPGFIPLWITSRRYCMRKRVQSGCSLR